MEENTSISQSLQRVHSQPPPIGTSQSVHTSYGDTRRNQNVSPRYREDFREGYRHDQYRRAEHRGQDDYAARRLDRGAPRREVFNQRLGDYQGERYADVEDDARSHLVQSRVDRARVHR